MITKKYEQHNFVLYPYAKEMREVINGDEYKNAAVATAVDLEQMEEHYHNTFDEIYFVLEGSMKFEFNDPKTEKID